MATILKAGNATAGLSLTPDSAGTLEFKTGTGAGTTAMTIDATGNVSGVLKSGTAIASTSGTSIDFTGIPSTAKRITVMFNTVSTNGTSAIIVQLGSTTFTTSGYSGAVVTTISTTSATVQLTSGFIIGASLSVASALLGSLVVTNLTANTWAGMGIIGRGNEARVESVAGAITIGGVLDRVRITTAAGTDTFDAGSINILYE